MAPIKRHKALIPVSRDHHHGLLLCWKIREGLKKGISKQRIKNYTDFFYETQLIPHFALEESELFPLLEKEHPMIKKALEDHQILERLFQEEEEEEQELEFTLRSIEQKLQEHIRFEERVLFNEIQTIAGEEKLRKIEELENDIITPDPDDWDDKFWER